MKEREVIGEILYWDSGELCSFYSEEKFLKKFKETINYYGITGWSYACFSESLLKKVDKIIIDEFGEFK